MGKINVFDYIEQAADVLKANAQGFIHAAEKVTEYLTAKLAGVDATIGVSYRIKTSDSLKEKILRNNLYRDAPSDRIVYEMHDVIGVKVECRFFKDEEFLYERLRELFAVATEDGLYCPADKKAIRLKLDTPQPEHQKNGFAIYRIDGKVVYGDTDYNFELQIKSLVNSFWSEIEHKLIYKNNRLNPYDSLMKEMLASTHESLTGIDHQLSLIFDRVSDNSVTSQQVQLKLMMAHGLNDMFTAIVKASTGLPVSIAEYSEAIVDYLVTASSFTADMTGEPFFKAMANNMAKALTSDKEAYEKIRNIDMTANYGGMLASLMQWLHDIDYSTIKIGETIVLDAKLDGDYGEVAKIFLNELNTDFYLNTFFHIFFSLERGTDDEDFADYIRFYTDRILGGKTLEQRYRTLARLSELPAHKLPLIDTIEMLAKIG